MRFGPAAPTDPRQRQSDRYEATMAGLLPILWSSGTGSEVMSRIAAPMVGGMISSTVLTLAVIPAIHAWVKGWGLRAAR